MVYKLSIIILHTKMYDKMALIRVDVDRSDWDASKPSPWCIGGINNVLSYLISSKINLELTIITHIFISIIV